MQNINKNSNNSTYVVTPHAAFIVWNFQDSLASWNVGDILNKEKDKGTSTSKDGINTVSETVISTMSLRSIQTQKQKAAAAGTFTIQLAPTKNWVAALTPGSWCAILMSTEAITQNDIKHANPRKLKMFGKILSVRSNTTVDQESGSRVTSYTVIGEDWGHVWMNNIYMDERAVAPSDEVAWTAAVYKIDDLVRKASKTGHPSTSDIVSTMIHLWGDATQAAPQSDDLMLSSGPNFTLPTPVANFLSVDPKLKRVTINQNVSDNATKLSDVIGSETHRQFGVLTGYNQYKDIVESVGLIRPTELNGTRTIWQVMHQVCNPTLNELVTDLDFDGDQPRLRLWKRIKPFVIDKTNEQALTKDEYLRQITSEFTNLKRTVIPKGAVLSVDSGTNWRDKYNFIEVRIDASNRDDITDNQTKINSQVYDQLAFQREGFRPLIMTTSNFLPAKDGVEANIWDVTKWKYLLKEWYFDTHRMLNGSMTIVGQNIHIPVGSNIMVDASVFSNTGNLNKANRDGKATHVLAHVEGVAHMFNENDGTRSFFTTINFVRGILVDKNGRIVKDQEGALRDKNSNKGSHTTNTADTFGSSAEMDIDPLKLKDRK